MFGNWLFAAVVNKDTNYEPGKAVAFETLCKIFCTPQRRTPFLTTYLERFYSVLSEGLRGEVLSLAAIVTSGETIFNTQLEGVKVLFPDFVLALRGILNASTVIFLPALYLSHLSLFFFFFVSFPFVFLFLILISSSEILGPKDKDE